MIGLSAFHWYNMNDMSSTNKYKIVEEALEQEIRDGRYDQTRKLPTEDDLIAKFNVSRNTIRKAIDVLTRRGFVIPVQGSGTFLRDVSHEGCINLEDFHGLTHMFPLSRIETRLIAFQEIPADVKIANILRVDIGAPLYYVKRLRLVDDQPYVVEISYFNREIVPYLNREIITTSIYGYITSDPKKQIGFVDRIIRADVIDDEDASLLGVAPNSPALVLENRAMLRDGRMFDYSLNIHNYARTKLLKLSNFM